MIIFFSNPINITSLDPFKNCGIKKLYLYGFNMDIFNDENFILCSRILIILNIISARAGVWPVSSKIDGIMSIPYVCIDVK